MFLIPISMLFIWPRAGQKGMIATMRRRVYGPKSIAEFRPLWVGLQGRFHVRIGKIEKHFAGKRGDTALKKMHFYTPFKESKQARRQQDKPVLPMGNRVFRPCETKVATRRLAKKTSGTVFPAFPLKNFRGRKTIRFFGGIQLPLY